MTEPAKTERSLEIIYRDPAILKADPRNARTHSPEQIAQLQASIREFGFTNPVLLRPDLTIGAGHGRVEAAKAEGLGQVPTCIVGGLTDDQWRAYAIADNKLALNAGWDTDILAAELQALAALDIGFEVTGFSEDDLALLAASDPDPDDQPADSGKTGAGSLADRFGIPPFSVLNAREGWWQDRKRAWLALGIASEVGRGENLGTLGAIAPNQQTIMSRTGSYADGQGAKA